MTKICSKRFFVTIMLALVISANGCSKSNADADNNAGNADDSNSTNLYIAQTTPKIKNDDKPNNDKPNNDKSNDDKSNDDQSEVKVQTFDGAKLLGKIKSENDSVMQLAKLLKNEKFPYSCLDVNAEINPRPITIEGNNLTLEIKITITVNENKFNAFAKKLNALLTELKTESGTVTLKGEPSRRNEDLIKNTIYFKLPINENKSNFRISIYTKGDQSLTNTDWNYYDLSPKFALLFSAYQNLIVCADVALNNEAQKNIKSIRKACCFTQLLKTERSPYFYNNNTIYIRTPNNGGQSFRHEKQNFEYGLDKFVNEGSAVVENDLKYIRECLQEKNYDRLYIPYSAHIFPFPDLSVAQEEIFIYPSRAFTITDKITITSEELSSVKSIVCRAMSENPTMDEFYKELPELLNKFNPR
ncbi:MAG: hypothetical protein LBP59_04920 [Planctomycetaceae bacterium]|jgi:hypothetical protein|nr:hypothetical protein [Planctomycetaceae bacterium]